MPRFPRHSEHHVVERLGWLRAAVLGANDGLVSNLSLVMGIAGANAGGPPVLIDTDFAAADEIQHEIVPRVLADLDGTAGYFDPPIRKGR